MGGEVGGEESRTTAPHHRLNSTESPTNNNITYNNNHLDPNNAAYLALRNHPETTIRAVNQMRSENEESPRNMEENIFKQVGEIQLTMG